MFCFAWVDASEITFGPQHQVEDEQVFSFRVEHAEGEFASLSIEIRNPRIGLLAPARKTWAWLSWNDGTETAPLFFGRLVGVPGDLHQDIVTLAFTARPADYNVRKQALAETLKVAPFWDPIFIAADKRGDPDVVLEARSELWHIDRVSHAVTVSDVLVGEEGIEEFPASEVFFDSVSIKLDQPPLRTVTVEGTVNWKQPAGGVMDVLSGSTISTHTGDGLISGWPKAGANIGGGWSVEEASAIDLVGIGQMKDDKFQTASALEGVQFGIKPYPGDWIFRKTMDWSFFAAHLVEAVLIPLWHVATTLRLRYEAERQRQERVRFTLSADVQPIVTLPGEDEVLGVNLSSADIGEQIEGEVPIGDPRRRSYFPTDRGLRSLEYLLAIARAQLCLRSRAVEVSFDCCFERAVGLSCRKNARLFDPRLPGGQALGKIIAYSFRADGGSGQILGSVTIGCAVGYGGAVTEFPGEPAYVEEDYVTPDYQAYSGTVLVLGSGDLGYSVPIDAPNDDGLDLLGGLRPAQVVSGYQVLNPPAQQRAALLGNLPAAGATDAVVNAAKEIIRNIPTQVQFTIKPVTGGPFESVYDIDVSELKLPKMLDLEAAA